MKVAILTLLLGVGGCCDGCRCAKKYLASPEEEPAKELVKERLLTAKDIAKQLCGVDDAQGLEVNTIELSVALAIGTAKVEATPIAPKPAKAVVCSGAIAVSFSAVSTDDSGKVTAWKVTSLEVEEVKTPGHEWKKPASGDD